MRAALLGILATAVFAFPARAEVVRAGPEGFIVRHGVAVSASQADAWQQLVRPAGWWQSEHTYSGDAANLWIDSQATGCFCEKLPLPAGAPEGQRPGSIEHMRIVYAAPPRALRMVGSLGPLQSEALTGTLTISLAANPKGGTRILMEYVVGGFMRMKPEEIGALVDKVLGEQMAALAGKLGPTESAAAEAPDGGAAADGGEPAGAPDGEGEPKPAG